MMKRVILSPNRSLKVEYSPFDRSSSASHQIVGHIHVESNVPVTTFVVDAGGLNEFMSGHNSFPHYAGEDDKYIHDFTVADIFKPWYLIIVNFGNVQAHVQYSADFGPSKN